MASTSAREGARKLLRRRSLGAAGFRRASGRLVGVLGVMENGGVIVLSGADCRFSMTVVGTVASGRPIFLIGDKIATPSGHDWRQL
jgi:hypothetical protein